MVTKISPDMLDQEVLDLIDAPSSGEVHFANLQGQPSDNSNLVSVLNTKVDASSLASVAQSGSYNDLSDQPVFATVSHSHDTIYAPISHHHGINEITGLQAALDLKTDTSSLALVATSGLYDDLTGKPRQPNASEITTGTDTTSRLWSVTNIVDAIQQHASNSGAAWGSITGLLSSQADLQSALDAKEDTDTNILRNADIGVSIQAQDPVLDNTTAAFTLTQQAKLLGIEENATADQSGAEIKALYEAQANTNVLSDANWNKLLNVPNDTNSALSSKANASHTHFESDITDLGNYIEDAPVDGKEYARKNGGWSEVVGSGSGGGEVEQTSSGVIYAKLETDYVFTHTSHSTIPGMSFEMKPDTLYEIEVFFVHNGTSGTNSNIKMNGPVDADYRVIQDLDHTTASLRALGIGAGFSSNGTDRAQFQRGYVRSGPSGGTLEFQIMRVGTANLATVYAGAYMKFTDMVVAQTAGVGPAGVGVPAGGGAGQVLAKIDGTDFNTEWINAPTGGSGSGLSELSEDPSPQLGGDLDVSGYLIAGRNIASDGSKLDGIAVGASANSSDAVLLSRSSHTGTQLLSTISDAGSMAGIDDAPNDGGQYLRSMGLWFNVETFLDSIFPDAPNDGQVYARQNEGWLDITNDLGGGGASYVPDIFFAELNASFASATTWQDIPWSGATRSGNSYTHIASSGSISLAAGDYEIHTKVMGECTGNNRVETSSQILLDGVQQSEMKNYSQRNSSQNEGGVIDFTCLIGVTSGQILKVQTRHSGTTNNITIASILIRKLAN